MLVTEFMDQVAPLPDYEDSEFVAADFSLGAMATTRAYLTFKTLQDVFIFKDKFDGYVFVDQKGNEYQAVVEFAPFQGLSRSRAKKRDLKVNTIEEDSHYVNFLETLKTAEENKTEGKLEYSYQVKEEVEITTTPLLEFLANKKREKIAERKKKQDERKKRRDDEKQRKKQQVAKGIPEPIKEEKQEKDKGKFQGKSTEKNDEQPDEDGIVVRVVPSRLDRKQREKVKEAERQAKREKEKERNRERKEVRDKERRERREKDKEIRPAKNQKEPKSVKEIKSQIQPEEKEVKQKESVTRETVIVETKASQVLEPKTVPTEDRPEKEANASATVKTENTQQARSLAPKREVKKYSERRKIIRERAEQRRLNTEAENDAIVIIDDNEIVEDLGSLNLDAALANSSPANSNVQAGTTLNAAAKEWLPTPWVVREKSNSVETDQPRQWVVKESHAEKESESSDASKPLVTEEEKSRNEPRIRNKNRPALEIYKPRRVRLATNFSDSDNKPTCDQKLEEKKGFDDDKRQSKDQKLTKKDRGKYREKEDRGERRNRMKKPKSIDSDYPEQHSLEDSQVLKQTDMHTENTSSASAGSVQVSEKDEDNHQGAQSQPDASEAKDKLSTEINTDTTPADNEPVDQ